MLNTFIYCLLDPRDGATRYVGKANDPDVRYKNHLNKAKDKETDKKKWVNELKQLGMKPILNVIASVPKNNWRFWEFIYVQAYKKIGCDLLNHTVGGEGATFANKTSYKKGHNAKVVVQLNKCGIHVNTFSSVQDAVNIFGKSLDSVLHGKTKTAYGFLWLYKDVYDKMDKIELDEFITNALTKDTANNGYRFQKGHTTWSKGKRGHILHGLKLAKRVKQIDIKTNIVLNIFRSAVEAADSVKCTRGNIDNCCTGRSKSAKKFKWEYILN